MEEKSEGGRRELKNIGGKTQIEGKGVLGPFQHRVEKKGVKRFIQGEENRKR